MRRQAGTTLNKKRLPPSTGIPLKDGDVLVFGGSSRTHTLHIHQRDALQLLEEQHAALTKQLAALEKEIADPAAQHVLEAAPGLAGRPRGHAPLQGPMPLLRASSALGQGGGRAPSRLGCRRGAAATRQCSPDAADRSALGPPRRRSSGCCPRPSGSTRTSARSSWATYPTT